MLRLTKRYPFSASHRLHTEKLSDEENRRLFGKCNYPFGHGHNYVLEISLVGEPDSQSGQLVPRPELDEFVRKAALEDFDHANLNTDVAEFKEVVPTTENLIVLIDRRLRDAWHKHFARQPVRLERIRVVETAKNSFEIRH